MLLPLAQGVKGGHHRAGGDAPPHAGIDHTGHDQSAQQRVDPDHPDGLQAEPEAGVLGLLHHLHMYSPPPLPEERAQAEEAQFRGGLPLGGEVPPVGSPALGRRLAEIDRDKLPGMPGAHLHNGDGASHHQQHQERVDPCNHPGDGREGNGAGDELPQHHQDP